MVRIDNKSGEADLSISLTISLPYSHQNFWLLTIALLTLVPAPCVVPAQGYGYPGPSVL